MEAQAKREEEAQEEFKQKHDAPSTLPLTNNASGALNETVGPSNYPHMLEL